VNATRGFYDSELLVSKTIQIIEGQMQAQRDAVATRIITRIKNNESAVTYPLSAALHDLEEYYRAGTVSEGLIKAVTDAGNAAQDAAATKASVMLQGGSFDATDTSAKAIRDYLAAGGSVAALNACIPRTFAVPAGVKPQYISFMFGANFRTVRMNILACARNKPA
jgi:hypothetical protein